MIKDQLENAGNRPLDVPGFNDLPVYLELPLEERFAHGSREWVQHPNLTARELAMLNLMNDLTEKHDWHTKVFDQATTSAWRKGAMSRPLFSERAWEWCLAELQDKANLFEKTGRVVVLNTGSGICKSDHLLSPQLRAELREGIVPLLVDVQRCWGDKTDQQEVALVDPSLFPLVYGKTRVLADREMVSLDTFLNSSGQGIVSPKHGRDDWGDDWDSEAVMELEELENHRRLTGTTFWVSKPYGLYRFSTHFQWLPCEVRFTGESSFSVRITSYINNLHPIRFKSLYGTVEKLISLAIKPWNDILIKGDCGRWPRRINAWGLPPWEDDEMEWPSYEELRALEEDRTSAAFKALVQRIKEYLALPNYHSQEQTIQGLRHYGFKRIPDEWETKEDGLYRAIRAKWLRIYHWEHPDAGVDVSYKEWRAGPSISDSQKDHKYYTVSLQEEFLEKGLQVMVKIGSKELTPENPSYKGGVWQLEATLNEHIVATAMFIYDAKNITNSVISFRNQTKMEPCDFEWDGDDEFEQLLKTYAIPGHGQNYAAYQDLGTVPTPEGRLLAWPNTVHHRVEPFTLIDPTQSGHQRFVILYLVDPHYRICSTRNVPPQQHDWWAEAALDSTGFAKRGMPQEILDLIKQETGEWPMGMEEAEELREELEEERDERVSEVGCCETYEFQDQNDNTWSSDWMDEQGRDGYGKLRVDLSRLPRDLHVDRSPFGRYRARKRRPLQ